MLSLILGVLRLDVMITHIYYAFHSLVFSKLCICVVLNISLTFLLDEGWGLNYCCNCRGVKKKKKKLTIPKKSFQAYKVDRLESEGRLLKKRIL